MRFWVALAAAAVFAAGGARAEDGALSVSGYVAGDVRVFPQNRLHGDQKEQTVNPSLVLKPELAYETNGGNDRLVFVPFARIDAQDGERTHADIREAKWLHVGEGWDLRLGIDKVFWGVTESRHLVDIINQTDAVEDVDGEDKLGQPMVNVGFQRDWGDLNLMVMPYHRERTFPGQEGRLRAAVVVDTDRAVYEHSLGRMHPDMAIRYATFIGDYDIGLSHFRGTSREPRAVLGANEAGTPVFVPHYDIIDQTGVDFQATIEEWLWKLEGIYRQGHGKDFAAVSGGLEYTFFGIVGEAGDLGVIAEYHYDRRDATAPGTIYNADFFLGGRITLNDEDDTDFLAGVLVDRFTGAQSYSMEADTRLTDQWTAEIEVRITNNLTPNDTIYGARRDSHAQVRLIRYF